MTQPKINSMIVSTEKPMKHLEYWFYGVFGFSFTILNITVSSAVDAFGLAIIGAAGAAFGTWLVKLTSRSWQKSWKPIAKRFWYLKIKPWIKR